MNASRSRSFLWPILAFLLILFCAIPAEAKHLVGGSVSYKYLGRSGPNLKFYKYRVILTVYRDALGGGPQFDEPILIGLYDNGPGQALMQTFSVEPASVVGKRVDPVAAGTPCK